MLLPIRAVLALTTLAMGTPIDPSDNQQPVLTSKPKPLDLISELRKASIIPTVLDPFTPLLTLTADWKKASAHIGNDIKPKKAKKEPRVHFLDTVPSPSSSPNDEPIHPLSGIQLTVALTDPDAPSRDDPKWSQVCHWLATDVPLTSLASPSAFLPLGLDDEAGAERNFTTLVPYKAPGPPPKTGAHRYVFVALAPVNGTTERLDLRAPAGRMRWGFENGAAGIGVREWARANGLGVVGANFVYAQHKKQ